MGMMDFVKRIQQWGDEQNQALKEKNQAHFTELGAALAQQGEPQGMLTAGYYKLFK